MKKIIKIFFIIVAFIILLLFVALFVGISKEKEDILWGVNFSAKHAANMGLDFKETYIAILDDLKARKIKLAVHWDDIEPEKDRYDFRDIDFMIDEAEKRNASLILVIGIKTPRWPECHIPSYAEHLTKEEQQSRILKKIEQVVLRYKDRDAIWAWQVENEPFFDFGICPWLDKDFLKKEVELVRTLDNSSPIIISESGEFSLWNRAAGIGDIVGTTIYRIVWSKELKRHIGHVFPPVFYERRAKLINWIFGKEVICIELQAEPWGSTLLYYSPLEEQEKTMNLEQFRKNISFAKKTQLPEIYLWGAEWWYWMKVKHNQGEIWEEAKKLF